MESWTVYFRRPHSISDGNFLCADQYNYRGISRTSILKTSICRLFGNAFDWNYFGDNCWFFSTFDYSLLLRIFVRFDNGLGPKEPPQFQFVLRNFIDHYFHIFDDDYHSFCLQRGFSTGKNYLRSHKCLYRLVHLLFLADNFLVWLEKSGISGRTKNFLWFGIWFFLRH